MGHVLPKAPWSGFAMINPFPALSPKSELKKKQTNKQNERKKKTCADNLFDANFYRSFYR